MPRVLPRLVVSCQGDRVRETNAHMIQRDGRTPGPTAQHLESGRPGCPTLGGAGRSWRHHPTGQTTSATGGEGNKELLASLLGRATAVATRAAGGRTAAVIPGNTHKPRQGNPAADNARPCASLCPPAARRLVGCSPRTRHCIARPPLRPRYRPLQADRRRRQGPCKCSSGSSVRRGWALPWWRAATARTASTL